MMGTMLKKNWIQFLFFAVAPTLLLLFIGSIYSRIFIENIPFGVVDLDNTALSRTIVRQFSIHPGMKLTLFTDSETELADAVAVKKVYGGIIIPKGLSRDVSLKKAPKVLIYIDGTNLFVGNNLQSYASTVMGTVGASFQIASMEARGMVPGTAKSTYASFSYGERVLYDPALSFLKYQMHVLFLFVIQTLFFANYLLPLLIKGKAGLRSLGKGSTQRRALVKELASGIGLSILILCFSTYLALEVTSGVFQLHLGGDLLKHLFLMVVFFLDLCAMALVFASIGEDQGNLQMSYLVFSVALIMTAGIAWPAYMMPPGFAALIQAIWPLQNIAYPFKALHLKGLPWLVLAPRILEGILFAAVWGTIGIFGFKKSAARTSAVPDTRENNE